MREIPRERALERLRIENPWWTGDGGVDHFFRNMSRRAYFDIFSSLAIDSQVRRAVVLLGPRRVGKTVLVHHTIQALIDRGHPPTSIAYVSIDHPLYNGLSLEDLLGLCSEASGSHHVRYMFFDEIQYLPAWERELKSLVDTNRSIRFVATGSAAAALRLKSIESGAGRFTQFVLPPLSFHEYRMLLGEPELDSEDGWAHADDIGALNEQFVDYLNLGGYPEALFSPEIRRDPGRFIKSDIIDKVLLRDLPSLYGIHNIQELNALFTTLAYNTASEVSLEKLSQGSGIAKNTIKRYIEYLEAAFLLRRISRIDRNARRFKRQPAFKVYLTNPSMRAALFAPIGADDDDMGGLVETAMFAQWFHGEEVSHHYARWQRGEVDMVWLDANGEPAWAAEAKWSDRVVDKLEELKPLLAFCEQHDLSEAVVTTRTVRDTRVRDGLRLEYVPAALYCYTVGLNVSRGRASELQRRLAAGAG